ncbi:membrane-spanning 4-domains subfamily A member 4A-like isoform X2 [Vulpes lagopus]|uniref:membrane-spanning 4-domains subfamily A member 4A-like isoform X2 n=1 Tax=Vulpes lagopus TaxID=494514 RepID=UPI001BC992B0|nr:membrane-spanning 4-domains subfamily A member 4A-like isoform X2 [Vulpes lagopus]
MRSSFSAAMATTQGPEGTTPGTGSGVYQPEQTAILRSHLHKGISEKFLKGEPKALGVVQILIALMVLSFTIIHLSITLPFKESGLLGEHDLFRIVGSLMFITSGSLSVAAGNRTTKGLIRSSLGVNITSSILAAIGAFYNVIHLDNFKYSFFGCRHDTKTGACLTFLFILMGLDATVILLNVLEFCIAVSLSSFGCKVTCCHTDEVVWIMPSNPHMAETAAPAPFAAGLMPPTD